MFTVVRTRRPADDEAILVQVGARVAELRIAASLSQEALAERIEVAPQYLARIERGRHAINLLMLQRLAKGLDVPIASLLRKPRSTAPKKPGRPRGRARTLSRRPDPLG